MNTLITAERNEEKCQLSLAIFGEILAVGSVDRIRQITKYLSGRQKASTDRLGFAQFDKDGEPTDESGCDFIFIHHSPQPQKPK